MSIKNCLSVFSAIFLTATLFMSLPVVAEGKLDLNRANAEQLEKLPGIGKVLAAEIVADRSNNGAFESVEDLSRISGISSRLIANIYDLVLVRVKGKKPQKDAANVQKIKERFNRDPSIKEVRDVAIEYARANPQVIDSWRARARNSALLPEVRTRFDSDYDDGITTRRESGEADVVTDRNGDNLGFEVRATWDLNFLVFHPQEMAVAREAVRLTTLRDNVVDEVTRRFYERRRLMV